MTEQNLTELLLIRHGETQWNLEERLQGQKDSPLTPLGIRQARALAERLAADRPAFLYTSDLPRAYRTAEAIARRTGLAIQTDARLREQNYGIFDGERRQDIPQKFVYNNRLYIEPDYVIPSGESLRQLQERAVICINDLAQRHAGERIAIVSHGGILNTVFRHVLGLDLSQPRKFILYNASVSAVFRNGEHWSLGTWSDISHLRDLERFHNLS